MKLQFQELHGLKAIVMFLHSLPSNKKNVPELIHDPIALIKDVRTLVEQHRHDSPEAAVTGKSILRGPDQSDKPGVVRTCSYYYSFISPCTLFITEQIMPCLHSWLPSSYSRAVCLDYVFHVSEDLKGSFPVVY